MGEESSLETHEADGQDPCQTKLQRREEDKVPPLTKKLSETGSCLERYYQYILQLSDTGYTPGQASCSRVVGQCKAVFMFLKCFFVF